jgi:hypothetical protein
MIMDKGVEKYAIVVKEIVVSKYENMEDIMDESDVMSIKYFTDMNKARQWLLQ